MPFVLIHCLNDKVTRSKIEENAASLGFNPVRRTNPRVVEIHSRNRAALDNWAKQYEKHPDVALFYEHSHPKSGRGTMHPHFHLSRQNQNQSAVTNTTQVPPYTVANIAAIYGFPQPKSGINNVIGVISLGGGLTGTISSSGILTNGDVQTYWKSLGMTSSNMPTVVIVSVDGAKNSPSNPPQGPDIENALDVETIGACCPSSNTKIVFYLAPNTNLGFYDAINTAINDKVNKPSIISISWGSAEIDNTTSQMKATDQLFQDGLANGINVCCSAGDDGCYDGVNDGKLHVDFPASSPNAVSCGGTTLNCPTLNYVGTGTTETAWSYNSLYQWGTGGGVSNVFAQPSYQAGLPQFKSGRVVPDLALNADPLTGVIYIVGGKQTIVGGTSVVAPAVAGFLASIGVKSFVNPQIYTLFCTHNASYHDIITGYNGAFGANAGYDACTGLGSINGSVLAPLLH